MVMKNKYLFKKLSQVELIFVNNDTVIPVIISALLMIFIEL